MRRYQVAHLDGLDRIPVAEGLEWRPIRRRFGIRAFGVNAYTSERVGGWVVEEHTEERLGHEELYLVVSGRARFTLDGEEVDAPAGTLVFLAEPSVKRVAVSEEEGTTVLALGAKPGEAFAPSTWEWYFEAEHREPAEAVALLEAGLAELGERPVLLYHLARNLVRAGRGDDAAARLRRALELEPELRGHAEGDEALAPLLRPS